VDERVTAPKEFVKNGEIILNISPDATGGLKLGNEWIEFKARFGGVARDILVPVDQVIAVYARENGQGMSFPKPNGIKGASAQRSPSGVDASVGRGHASSESSSSTPTSDKPMSDKAQPPTLQMVFSSDSEGGGGGEEPTPSSPSGGNLKSHLKRIK
jgi:stringent starvation protein B